MESRAEKYLARGIYHHVSLYLDTLVASKEMVQLLGGHKKKFTTRFCQCQ